MIMPALEGEGPGLVQACDHQIVRLLEARMGEGGLTPEREIFGADAAHHAADEPPAGEHVDHRVLLGERQRMLAQAEGVAEDGDLARFACAAPAPRP